MHEHGNLHKRVIRLRNELDEVQKALDRDPTNFELSDEEVVYVQAFNNAKLDEERFLKQKAKIEWLEVGDSNLAYFHKSIKSQNQRSRIDVITTFDNVEVTGNHVPNVFVSHYMDFLGLNMMCDGLDSDDLFQNKVFDMANENMMKPVTNKEIKRAMFGIRDEKASSLDGFTFAFFKKGWDVVGQDVCNAVRDFFVNGKLLKEINHTFLALVSKTTTPLKGIKEVVSENHSAFVSGRRISKNILITQELMHNYYLDRGPPRGDVVSANVIMDSLNEFKAVSGLVPSILKSKLPVKYLGVPLISSRLLNKDCKILVKKAQNRIDDWKNMSLSFAGRLQLCRSVISSMQISSVVKLKSLGRIFAFLSMKGVLVFVALRDITREGFTIQSKVADIVTNGTWNWPLSWLAKAPNLALIVAPILVNSHDCIQWRDINGNMAEFSVKHA
nr:hypothetical protein [Tanacetum cinerariifolium]